jgi:hypothetical protein
MEKCKATFFAPDGCNNRHIYVGDNMYFWVVGQELFS